MTLAQRVKKLLGFDKKVAERFALNSNEYFNNISDVLVGMELQAARTAALEAALCEDILNTLVSVRHGLVGFKANGELICEIDDALSKLAKACDELEGK